MKSETEGLICGIVMPISAIDGCSEGHWADVIEIISEAIEDSGFEPNIVSNADDVGMIHKRIIQNLYENPIVVCDVSGKNPNVMFELGIRLAFDKPTIIIKDDKTSYSFDTSSIEHLEYPRDLRFSRIVEFKQKLSEKIRSTHDKATTDPNYTTFLKHFGEFTVAKIDKKEVSSQEFVLDELRSIKLSLERMGVKRDVSPALNPRDKTTSVCMRGVPEETLQRLIGEIQNDPNVESVSLREMGENHKHIMLRQNPDGSDEEFYKIKRGLRIRANELKPKRSGISVRVQE